MAVVLGACEFLGFAVAVVEFKVYSVESDECHNSSHAWSIADLRDWSYGHFAPLRVLALDGVIFGASVSLANEEVVLVLFKVKRYQLGR